MLGASPVPRGTYLLVIHCPSPLVPYGTHCIIEGRRRSKRSQRPRDRTGVGPKHIHQRGAVRRDHLFGLRVSFPTGGVTPVRQRRASILGTQEYSPRPLTRMRASAPQAAARPSRGRRTCAHAFSRTGSRAAARTRTRTRTHARAHTHKFTRVRMHTHARTGAHRRTRTHTMERGEGWGR